MTISVTDMQSIQCARQQRRLSCAAVRPSRSLAGVYTSHSAEYHVASVSDLVDAGMLRPFPHNQGCRCVTLTAFVPRGASSHQGVMCLSASQFSQAPLSVIRGHVGARRHPISPQIVSFACFSHSLTIGPARPNGSNVNVIEPHP